MMKITSAFVISILLTFVIQTDADVNDAVETLTEDYKLLPTDTSHNTHTGTSVDLNNGVIAAGATAASGYDDSGIVYIWESDGSGWTLVAELTESSLDDGDKFGESVEFSDDGSLIIGASNYGPSGSTYRMGTAFVYTDWSTSQEIGPLYATQNDFYGTAVAMDGDRIAIGGPNEVYDGTYSGAASVFEWNGSIFIEKDSLIAPDDPAVSNDFGESLDIDGDWLVVGNPDGIIGTSSGSIHIFARQSDATWTESQVITAPSDAIGANSFGYEVSLEDDILVVGTSGGYAFTYALNGLTWEYGQTLVSGDGDWFGRAVDTDGERIVVGSPYHDINATNDGAAWVFESRNGAWLPTHLLTIDGGNSSDLLGYSVAIDGMTVIAGAYNDDDVAVNSGAVFVYEDVIADCNGNGIADATDLANGTVYDCNNNSVPDICETDCNSNGIADLCDIEDGTSEDCDGNGVPDECEDDCNNNGIPDACDMSDDARRDYNGNGFLDECESIACWNVTTGISYSTITSAIADASNGEELSFFQYAIDAGPFIDLDDIAITLAPWGDVNFEEGSVLILADGASIEGDSDNSLDFSGNLQCLTGDRASIHATGLTFSPIALVEIGPGSILTLDDSDGSFPYFGTTEILGGILSLPNDGTLVQDGLFSGFGVIDAGLTNYLDMNIQADLEILGDCLNETTGVITVQSGVFTVFGSLTNNGIIVGDFSGLRSRNTDGVTIFGDLTLGISAMLDLGNDGRLTVAGSFDCAINDASRLKMAEMELRFVGTNDLYKCEVCSYDSGESGFAESNALMKRLRVGPSLGTIVELEDNHENLSTNSEVMYVEELIIDRGTSFYTNGIKVYCLIADIDPKAFVDDASNIVIVDDSCEGDLDNSMEVDVLDLLSLIAQWGACETPEGCDADFDASGSVDVVDLLTLIAAWGPCE